MNLASLLEQANKFYGTSILVSEATRDLAGESLAFREIDSLRVSARLEPERVFELMDYATERGRSQTGRSLREVALALYRKLGWDGAEIGRAHV